MKRQSGQETGDGPPSLQAQVLNMGTASLIGLAQGVTFSSTLECDILFLTHTCMSHISSVLFILCNQRVTLSRIAANNGHVKLPTWDRHAQVPLGIG